MALATHPLGGQTAARSPWPRWTMVPYLVLTDLQNTVLAAIVTLSDRVLYPAYAIDRGTTAALADQSVAGLIMWVPGSLVFLVAAVWVVVGKSGALWSADPSQTHGRSPDRHPMRAAPVSSRPLGVAPDGPVKYPERGER